MAAKLTRLTHKIAPSGGEPYHLHFSLQAASPKTFGYTLVKDISGVDAVSIIGRSVDQLSVYRR